MNTKPNMNTTHETAAKRPAPCDAIEAELAAINAEARRLDARRQALLIEYAGLSPYRVGDRLRSPSTALYEVVSVRAAFSGSVGLTGQFPNGAYWRYAIAPVTRAGRPGKRGHEWLVDLSNFEHVL
jgi:hypothetical protein